MPNIRQYDNKQTIDPQPLEQAAYRIERTGMIEGAAIRGGTAAIKDGLDKLGEHQDIQQTSDLMAQGATLSRVFSEDLNTTLKNADPSKVDEVSDKWQQSFEEKMNEYGSEANGPKAKEAALRIRSTIIDSLNKERVAQTSAISGLNVETNLNKSANDYAKTVMDNPSLAGPMIDLAKGSFKTMVEAHRGLSAVDAAKLNEDFTNKTVPGIANAGLEGIAQRIENGTMKPDDALKQISDPSSPLRQYATNEKYSEVQTRIAKAQATNAATQTRIADIQWPKIMTAVKEGVPGAAEAAQQFADNAVGPNAGDTAVLRAKKADELKDAITQGQVAQKYGDMPQPEIDAQRASLKAAAIAGDKNADYALKNNEARNAAFTNDRAAYMLSSDKVVASKYMAMFDANGNFAPTQQAAADYLNTSIAAQNRLYPTIPARVLTNEMAEPINLAMRGITQTGEGAENAASVLAHSAQTYGASWPNIGKELMDRHYINGDQFAASLLAQKPSAAALVPVLLSVSTMSGEQRTALHGISVDAANVAASRVFDTLNKTFANIPNAADAIGANTSAVAHLLQAKGVLGTTVSKGSLDAAAKSIGTTMLLDEYTIKDDTIRITNGQGIDADAVEAGSQKMRENLGGYEIDVPKSYSGLGSDAQRPNYIRQIQQSARFYTTPDNKGVTLYPAPGASSPVLVAGKPLTLTWKQLSAMGE